MGQYYNILTKRNGRLKVFNKKIKLKDGKEEYQMAKLTEHSWFNNDMVNTFAGLIYEKPTQVAWVGDYADSVDNYEINNSDLTKDVVKELYKKTYTLKEHSMKFYPLNVKTLYLVNWSKKCYLDMWEYYDKNVSHDNWCTHPLPLLTALGNGLGGGDYYGINEDKIGCWAFDILSFENEYTVKDLKDFTKVEFEFKEDC